MSQDSIGKFNCVTCGKEYRMCRKCAHSKIPYVAWRATACCPECYSVAETMNAHYYGKIDSAEAARRFKDAAWETIEHILPEVREYIEKVLDDASGEKEPVKTKAKKVQTDDK